MISAVAIATTTTTTIVEGGPRPAGSIGQEIVSGVRTVHAVFNGLQEVVVGCEAECALKLVVRFGRRKESEEERATNLA